MGLAVACGDGPTEGRSGPAPEAAPPVALSEPAYRVSPQGGTPATGPGARYNLCERIWCLLHSENFFIDHFETGHVGQILHDEDYGDVFVPQLASGETPHYRRASRARLTLCGEHVHPYLAGDSGRIALHDRGYHAGLGYDRAHFRTHGIRLNPCCVNGLGSGFLHSREGRNFRFHDVAYFRSNPEWGWQRPFQARTVVRETPQ